jgi:hypothetical protein
MRALLRSERQALFRQPPPELGTLHKSRVHIFDYRSKLPKLIAPATALSPPKSPAPGA